MCLAGCFIAPLVAAVLLPAKLLLKLALFVLLLPARLLWRILRPGG